MSDVIELRPAELLSDWAYNPAQGGPHVVPHTPAQIREEAGIIPDIYTEACLSMRRDYISAPIRGDAVDELARRMDDVYGYGGFGYPFGGTITDRGVYVSPYEEDPDLYPLVRLLFKHLPQSVGQFELYIYPHAICVLRDRDSREFKAARFD